MVERGILPSIGPTIIKLLELKVLVEMTAEGLLAAK